jgi:hypothetical protein
VLSQDSDDANQPVEDNLDKEIPPPLVFSDNIAKQPASPTRQSPQSSFSAYAAQPSGSKTCSRWAITPNSQKTSAKLPQGSKAAVGLEQQMTNYFDPAKHKKQDFKNGMTQFYANQLSNANKTITSLFKEVSCLHRGYQSQSNQVQEKITKQKLENQGLKSQIKLLKSKIELMQI